MRGQNLPRYPDDFCRFTSHHQKKGKIVFKRTKKEGVSAQKVAEVVVGEQESCCLPMGEDTIQAQTKKRYPKNRHAALFHRPLGVKQALGCRWMSVSIIAKVDYFDCYVRLCSTVDGNVLGGGGREVCWSEKDA